MSDRMGIRHDGAATQWESSPEQNREKRTEENILARWGYGFLTVLVMLVLGYALVFGWATRHGWARRLWILWAQAEQVSPLLATLTSRINPESGGATGRWSLFPDRVLHQGKQQTLYVGFDGVPFSLAQKIWEQRKPFVRGETNPKSNWNQPSRLISTFPSTTTMGFTGLFQALGAGPSQGYDAMYYSYQSNQVLGSLVEAYAFDAADYHQFFSYNRNEGFPQIVMYTVPGAAMEEDLAIMENIVGNSPRSEKIFFYLGPTDGAGHLDGLQDMTTLFSRAMDALELLGKRYQARFGRALPMVLFSDHGFHWAPHDQRHLKSIDVAEIGRELARENLELRDTLANDESVVAVTWGNISGADFYTSASSTEKVRLVLLQHEGIDLVMNPVPGLFQGGSVYSGPIEIWGRQRQEGGPVVLSKAVLETEERQSFGKVELWQRYSAEIGDPLKLRDVVEQMRRLGLVDQRGFAPRATWFAYTKEHAYPDPLFRIRQSFHSLVKNPATLLISTDENYEFGDELTRLGAAIRGGIVGTHGALSLDSSSAFLMTNSELPQTPNAISYEDALHTTGFSEAMTKTPEADRR